MKYFLITLFIVTLIDVLCNKGRNVIVLKNHFLNSQQNSNEMDCTYWFICYVKQPVITNFLGEALNLISERIKPSMSLGIPQFFQDFITDDADQDICFNDPFYFIQRMNAEDKEYRYVLVNFQEIEEEVYESYKKINK